jgi:hypothetical protein
MNDLRSFLFRQLILSVLLMAGASVMAQTLGAAVSKMKEGAGAFEKVYVRMQIRAIEEKTGNVVYQEKAEVKRDGENYFYALGDIELLLTKKLMVMVNHRMKQVSYTPNRSKDWSSLIRHARFDFDSLLRAQGESRYVGRSEGRDHFEIRHASGSIKKTHFFFQVQTSMMHEIKYEYKSGQLVTILFDVFESKPVFTITDFSEAAYIESKDKEVVLASRYSGYRLLSIDQPTATR